jgi:hypothetical protein
MSRSDLFNFENEPIWLIHDTNSLLFFNRFGREVSVTQDIWIEIVRTVPAIRDTRSCSSGCPGLLPGKSDAE